MKRLKRHALVLILATVSLFFPVTANSADPNYSLPDSYYQSQSSSTSSSSSTTTAPAPQPEAAPAPVVALPAPEPTPEPVPAPVVAAAPEVVDTTGTSGYDGGFYIKSKDAKYSLVINGRLQLGYSAVLAEDIEDKHSLMWRSAFLLFSGTLVNPNLTWEMLIFPLGSPSFGYGIISYHFMDELTLIAGYDSIMLNHQYLESGGKLQFVARSLEANRFNAGDSVGVYMSGALGKFAYSAGVFNGPGTDLERNLNQELAYALKLAWNPVGAYGGGEGDILDSQIPGITFDVTGAFFHHETDTQAKVIQGTGFAGIKWQGFSWLGEGSARYTDPNEFIREQLDVGFNTQVGYFLIPTKFEVALRYSALLDDINDVGVNLNMTNGNISSLGGAVAGVDVDGDSDNEYEHSVALNYFFNGYKAKIQAQYSLVIDGIPGADDRVNHIAMMMGTVGF